MAAGAAVVGGLGFWAASGSSAASSEGNINITLINEEVFDTSDNLFVFFLDKSQDLLDRKAEIQHLVRTLMKEDVLKRLSFYYNVRKDDDPPVPEGAPAEGKEGDAPPLRCLMYKGQRRTVMQVGSEVPLQKIVEFFTPLNESLTKAHKEFVIPKVNNDSFAEDVVKASSPARPILLQMFEDSCMLCFLMRPFVNSLAKLLITTGVPLQIKRLNIEKNDFPDRCPVARGTPTFVLFRGEEIPPDKWEEFRPKDLVERICKQYPNLPDSVLDKMEELQAGVASRFKLFSQLTMWTVEMRRLEELVVSLPPPPGSASTAPAAAAAATTEAEATDNSEPPAAAKKAAADEDSEFSTIASQMLAKDMKRTDLLPENLEYLQKEIDDIEHDAALLGVMLAQSVLDREQAEEEARKARSASRSRRS